MIFTITANPAMDKVFVLHDFRLNVTNRIDRMFKCIGGKGTHISVNLSILGIKSTALGVVNGRTGAEIIRELKRFKAIQIDFLRTRRGESRTNYVLVDGTDCTLISQKGNRMNHEEAEFFEKKLDDLVKPDDIVAISGDISNGDSLNIQGRLMDIANRRGGRVFLDCSGEALIQGVKKKPFLVKPNVDELSFFCGRNLVTKQEILVGMREMSSCGIRMIVVSCGSEGSLVFSDGKYYDVMVPTVQIKNTVGCGDALVAGLLAGFEQKMDTIENVKRANAIAAATAMDETTVGFDLGIVDDLMQRVMVEEISDIGESAWGK